MAKIILILTFIFLFSCSSKNAKDNDREIEKPTVAVVNYPLYYFAKTIGGDHVTVYFPEINGDPAYWKPTAEQVVDFQNARLIFANGAGYAKWMEKVSLPSSKIVITSNGFKNQWIETIEGVAHSHGAEGEHVHKGTAFTTWLNFKLAAEQAQSIYSAIIELLPEHAEECKRNFQELQANLGKLDIRMEGLAKRYVDKTLVASHPIYQYLEVGYRLNIISKHWEPDEMPTTEQWNSLKKNMDKELVQIMIWEAEPSTEIKSKLRELKVSFAVFDPAANSPKEGDFISTMNENLNQLEQDLP